MLIFWKARLVLFAVPKTGTTALEAALAPMADTAILNPPGQKHCNVRKYRRDLAPFFEQGGRRPLQLVAVMREPIAWLGSWYRYRARPALIGHPNSTSGLSFEAFVDAYLQEDSPDFARVGRQARFLEGGVDHLFRYDRPVPFLAFLEERLGALPDLPQKNLSPPGDTALSDTMMTRLRQERAADFAQWEDLCAIYP